MVAKLFKLNGRGIVLTSDGRPPGWAPGTAQTPSRWHISEPNFLNLKAMAANFYSTGNIWIASFLILLYICQTDTNIGTVYMHPEIIDFGHPSSQSSSPQCSRRGKKKGTEPLYENYSKNTKTNSAENHLNKMISSMKNTGVTGPGSYEHRGEIGLIPSGKAYNRCSTHATRPLNSGAGESAIKSKTCTITCAVQSVEIWGEGRLKKWSGDCSTINELVAGIAKQFNVNQKFELQYLDRDVSEYIDLEDSVFHDFKSQQYKLVRLMFPVLPDVECQKLNTAIKSAELVQTIPDNKKSQKPTAGPPRSLQVEKKAKPKLKIVQSVVRADGINEHTMTQRKSIRSCRKKVISYAEQSPSSPIPDAPACQRILFNTQSPTLSRDVPSPPVTDPMESLAGRLKITHLLQQPVKTTDIDASDDSDLLQLHSLGTAGVLGEDGPRRNSDGSPDDCLPLGTRECSGLPSSTDANSFGASPTIPEGLTPLPPRKATPAPKAVEEPATPRNAIKQLRFQLPDSPGVGGGHGYDDGRSAAPVVEPRTPAGYTAVTPTPERHRGVGCSLDDETGLFRTARRTAAGTPSGSGLEMREPISPTPFARRTLFPDSPRAADVVLEAGAADAGDDEVAADEGPSGRAFRLRRDALAQGLLKELNAGVFDGQLPPDLEIRWSSSFTRTAGMTSFKLRYCPDDDADGGVRVEHTAAVELSSKVLRVLLVRWAIRAGCFSDGSASVCA
jgi:hypothetical protein